MNNKKYGKDDYDKKMKKSIGKQFKTILIESGKDMTINSGRLCFAHYIIFSVPLFLFLIWLFIFYSVF
ncbi:hypothetical protein [Pseudolactococcus laudensis]|uniref:hypothetical protein n=1 Tax=Pseudolactococcus laudensis TaxID=1494461 RepID=UPI002FCC4DBD